LVSLSQEFATDDDTLTLVAVPELFERGVFFYRADGLPQLSGKEHSRV
jgi:hypothetical protein